MMALLQQFSFGTLCKGSRISVSLNRKVADFEAAHQQSHIPVSDPQRLLLGFGSSVISLLDPKRADMIATMGEITGLSAMKYMLNEMENSAEGLQILKMRPRINSDTIDLDRLSMLPEGSVGKTYINFLNKNKVTPDSRDMVQFVEDINLAYVMQRYREIHDLIHTVLDMPTNMLGEVTVKWFEAFQTRLPLCIFGGLFGAVRLAPKQRERYVKYYLPWAIKTGINSNFIMNIYFEQRWEQPIEDLLQELNIDLLILPKTKNSL